MRPDGSVRWIAARGFPVLNERGEVHRIAGIAEDITERKRAEEALRLTQYTIDNCSTAITWLRPDGKVIYVNEAVCRQLGYSMEELLSLSVSDIDPDWPADDWPTGWQKLKNAGVMTFESRHRRKNGHVFPVEITTNYIEYCGEEHLFAFVTDITERKRAEEALRLTQYSVDHSADAALWIRPDARFFYANNAACQSLGYSREELLELSVPDIDPEFPPEAWGPHIAELKQAGNLKFETRHQRKDGTTFPVEVTVSHSEFEGQEYVFAFATDITERKQGEEALRRSEERFRSLVENASEFIVILDENAKITYVSPPIEKVLGYRQEDVLGMNAFERVHPEDRPRLIDALARGMGIPGHVETAEYRDRHRDGSWRVMESTGGSLLHDPAVRGIVLNTRDITERKRSEQALREREETIRALVETSRDWIWSIDAQGVHTYSNPAIEGILGYRPDDLVGKPSLDLMHDDDRKVVEAGLPGWIAEKRGWRNLEIRWRHREGGYRYLESNAVPILDEAGQLTGFRGVDRDVTDRKQAEEEIRKLNEELEQRVEDRTAQLAAANQDLSEFAYVVSHDLKAPLRAIGQLSHWLVEDHGEALGQDGREKANMLVGRVRRMYNLIDGILSYSRIGRVEERGQEVDVDALVREVIGSLAPPEGLKVAVEGRLPIVTADRTRIHQVFQNLLGNAVKFMDKPDGHIAVGYAEAEDRWRFWVRDNGPGIDPKYHDKVFGIFQTLAPRDEREGTGIGLTLVKKIVEAYGGRIELASQVGQGCTFTFTLPK